VVVGGLGVPGVEVGLGAGAQLAVALVEPDQEPFGLSELLGGEPAGGSGQRAGAGSDAQPRDLVPEAELA
jgi:hypothetical protein